MVLFTSFLLWTQGTVVDLTFLTKQRNKHIKKNAGFTKNHCCALHLSIMYQHKKPSNSIFFHFSKIYFLFIVIAGITPKIDWNLIFEIYHATVENTSL